MWKQYRGHYKQELKTEPTMQGQIKGKHTVSKTKDASGAK